MSDDISSPPNPINKILIVMLKSKENLQSNREIYNLEEAHESHVLYVLIYENKPELLYVGPDVRLYTDNSYRMAIEELCKMLNINNVNFENLNL